jgi:hypothetical protein
MATKKQRAKGHKTNELTKSCDVLHVVTCREPAGWIKIMLPCSHRLTAAVLGRHRMAMEHGPLDDSLISSY